MELHPQIKKTACYEKIITNYWSTKGRQNIAILDMKARPIYLHIHLSSTDQSIVNLSIHPSIIQKASHYLSAHLSIQSVPDPEVTSGSPVLQADSLPSELPGKLYYLSTHLSIQSVHLSYISVSIIYYLSIFPSIFP